MIDDYIICVDLRHRYLLFIFFLYHFITNWWSEVIVKTENVTFRMINLMIARLPQHRATPICSSWAKILVMADYKLKLGLKPLPKTRRAKGLKGMWILYIFVGATPRINFESKVFWTQLACCKSFSIDCCSCMHLCYTHSLLTAPASLILRKIVVYK